MDRYHFFNKYFFFLFLLFFKLFNGNKNIFIIISFFIIFLLFIKTNLGNLYSNYVLESFKEIHHIKWPSKKETSQTTMMITAIVFIMGLILCLIDMLFFNFIKWVANFG